MNTSQTTRVGPRLKEIRISRKITLRAFADTMGLDAGNYSRVERGVFSPPARDKLELILAELGVDEREIEELLDAADLERGQLPQDLQNDETLVRELPILFRAIRRNDKEALDNFIEAVRKEGTA